MGDNPTCSSAEIAEVAFDLFQRNYHWDRPVRSIGVRGAGLVEMDILAECGVAEERVAAFCPKCGEQFGDGAALSPENLIDRKRFEIKSSDATITVNPEHSYLVEIRVINGRKHILIPADESVEINGLSARIASEN